MSILNGIESQSLEVVRSLTKSTGLGDLACLPSDIVQEIIDDSTRWDRLRTMCLWDAMVGTWVLQPYPKLAGTISYILMKGGAHIEGAAVSIINSAPLQDFLPRGIIFCLCSVFQLTGEKVQVSMEQLISSVEKIRIGKMWGRIASTELLWSITKGFLFLPVSRSVIPVMNPVEYEPGKFGLLEIKWEQKGLMIRPKLDYQAPITGGTLVAFTLEDSGRYP